MVIFKPTAILVYLKKKKKSPKNRPKLPYPAKICCQLFTLLGWKQICQQFLWVKVSEHLGGGCWVVFFFFFKENILSGFVTESI